MLFMRPLDINSTVRIPIGSRNVVADVVIYSDEKRSNPYIVVEAKRKLLGGVKSFV